jgi:hypothetical protein
MSDNREPRGLRTLHGVLSAGTPTSSLSLSLSLSLSRRYANKQSTPVTFLEDAARAGARFLDGCYVTHVTRDAATGRATGVEAVVTAPAGPGAGAAAGAAQYKLVVRARAVVSSCGALHRWMGGWACG